MSFNPDSDLSGTIARLFVYPVKSCAGIEVQQALLTETGLDLDRAWMVVDAQGVFLTQRALPRMALIRPQLKTDEMVLRAPGMLALHVAIDAVESPATVTVWRDTVPAWDMGAVAAQWFTDFLGQPCRLVRFDPAHKRLSSMAWTGGVEAPNQFADGFPILWRARPRWKNSTRAWQPQGTRRLAWTGFARTWCWQASMRTTKTVWTLSALMAGPKARCICSPSSPVRVAPSPISILQPHRPARWWATRCAPTAGTIGWMVLSPSA